MREQNKEYVCLIKPGKSTELSIQFLFSYKMDDDNLWKSILDKVKSRHT